MRIENYLYNNEVRRFFDSLRSLRMMPLKKMDIVQNKQKALRSKDLRDEFPFAVPPCLFPLREITLGLPTKSQPVTGRPGFITGQCVHETDSGTRSSHPSAPARTNRRLSAASQEGQVFLQSLSGYVQYIIIASFAPVNGGFAQ